MNCLLGSDTVANLEDSYSFGLSLLSEGYGCLAGLVFTTTSDGRHPFDLASVLKLQEDLLSSNTSLWDRERLLAPTGASVLEKIAESIGKPFGLTKRDLLR